MARGGGKAAKKDAPLPTVFDWKNPDYIAVYEKRQKWIENLRKITDKDAWAGLKDHYKDNPVDFITDWGMTFDPRNAEIGLPTWVPFVLFPRQEQFIDWLVARWKGREDGLTEKSRDMGATWLCVAFAVWMWRFHPGTVVGFGSRKEEYVDKLGDPKSIFWKIRVFIMALPKELRPAGYVEGRHAPFMRVVNPENGSAIVGEAGDNIGRGNRTSIYFKDESAFYERPMAVDAALSMTSNCKIDVSTANGAGNPFYQKRKGGKISVFTFHWKQDPRKDQAWYDRQAATLDPVILASEVDINYEASVGDAFIPGDLVEAAQARGPMDVSAAGPIQLGVDVARFGNNKSVITARRGRVVLWQKGYQGLSTTDLVGRVKQEHDAFPAGSVHQIAVDVIGVGAGVADQLRSIFPSTPGKPSIVVDVNCALRVEDGVNFNLRAQMYANAREWLQQQPNSLPNDPQLKSELTAIKYFFRGGLRLLESKEEMMKRGIASPDFADSLALTFAIPLVIRRQDDFKTAPFVPQTRELGMLG